MIRLPNISEFQCLTTHTLSLFKMQSKPTQLQISATVVGLNCSSGSAASIRQLPNLREGLCLTLQGNWLAAEELFICRIVITGWLRNIWEEAKILVMHPQRNTEGFSTLKKDRLNLGIFFTRPDNSVLPQQSFSSTSDHSWLSWTLLHSAHGFLGD